MTTPPPAGYSFLPWIQRGLARAIGIADEPPAPTVPPAPGPALAARVSLQVALRVEGASDVPSASVRLYGPGDVTGLDPGQIVRSDPRPGTTSFEAGYMPQVQFVRADLPWLFTPAAPGNAGSRLRPWLVLVAVRQQDGVRLDTSWGGPLPALEIASPANAADELPDLAQSWAWAHAQIAGLTPDRKPAEILDGEPGRCCSRLICPRRLAPDTGYLACVVPAFLAGVKAGLGDPVTPDDEARLDPAWTSKTPAVLRLPVYHSWEFGTGPAGNFETLVRRLRPRPLDPASARAPKLNLHAPGGGMPEFGPAAGDPSVAITAGTILDLQSVLRVPDPKAPKVPGSDPPPPWPDTTRKPFQVALEGVLTTAKHDTITAPVYGQVQAHADALPSAGAQPAWLREVNLDPRLRVAAAAGTRVVQDRQEQLMARAWEQAGAVRDANALLRGAQLARELGGVLMERHLRRLSADKLLAVTQPAHAQIELPLPADGPRRASPGAAAAAAAMRVQPPTPTQTVDAQLRASRIPEAAVSAAMRRLASPQGPIARRAMGAARVAPRTSAARVAPRALVAVGRRAEFDILGAVDDIARTPAPAPPMGMVSTASVAAPVEPNERRAMSPGSIEGQLLDRLAPETTVLDRAKTRVDAPASTWTRPDPLAPVATGPRFAEPMYEALQQVAPWLLLPRLEHVEADGVALLETTPRVIEAYMAGLNHEMSRELLWREYPADLSATAFRQFWDVSGQPGDAETLADIDAIADWGAKPLGTNVRGADSELVLIIRGELLRRYPTTTIYAAPALADGTLDAASRLAPMFRGTIAPDIAFVGFALSEAQALGTPGWYFAFEEYPAEPRFGFDEVAGSSAPPQGPDDVAWAHVPTSPSGHVDLTRPLLAGAPGLQKVWGLDAAGMARFTFQKPFRTAMHASQLLHAGKDARP